MAEFTLSQKRQLFEQAERGLTRVERKNVESGKSNIHKHHINERALGETETLENLITLCSAHHRQRHRV